jgi:hypothetical protein
MRLPGASGAAVGLALVAGLSGCVAGSGVDPDDAAQRAAVGSVLGAALGAGLGVTFAIDAGIGATVGAASGAAIGAAAGVLAAQPAVTYAPVAVPETAVIPNFYDGWAPGNHPPPSGSMAPPPLPKSG